MTFSTGEGWSLARGTQDIKVTIDGNGSVLTTGDTKAYYTISHKARIVGWYINSDVSGSVVVDVWKKTGGVPTNSDTIAGSEKPTLSSAQQNSDLTLTTWSQELQPGDTLGFEIESVTTITRVVLTLKIVL